MFLRTSQLFHFTFRKFYSERIFNRATRNNILLTQMFLIETLRQGQLICSKMH